MDEIARTENPQAPEQMLLRLSDVIKLTAISRTAIYRRLAEGSFPKPLDMGPRMLRWERTAIIEWIASRRAAPPAVDQAA